MTSPFVLSRRSLIGTLAGGLVASSAQAQSKPPAQIDLGNTTLRVAYYKGGWRTLLQAAGEDQTPYKIEWKELNNGVLHIEALNSDALDPRLRQRNSRHIRRAQECQRTLHRSHP